MTAAPIRVRSTIVARKPLFHDLPESERSGGAGTGDGPYTVR